MVLAGSAAPDPEAERADDGARRTGRPVLSETLVVETAIAFVEQWGLPALSMRRLGQVLGVEGMTLYRYVEGREHLLDAMVDALVRKVTDDTRVLESPYHGWQDFIQRLAHGVRDVARAHPHTFPLVASRPPEAPWLRPPLRSVEWVEMFLRGLLDEGFSDQAAVSAYRGFSSFLLGHLLLEVSTLGAAVGPLDFATDEAENGDAAPSAGGAHALDELSTIARLRDKLSEDQSAVEFEESLENLLERIGQLRSEDPALTDESRLS